MSPVWIRKRGWPGTSVTAFSAAPKVPAVSGLTGLSKPRWLSLTWTKLKSVVAASALPISRALGTPPAIVQTMAVPAQVMHSSTPRRLSRPGDAENVVVSHARGPSALRTARRAASPERPGLRAIYSRSANGIDSPAARSMRVIADSQELALPKDDMRRRFELLALPHLDAAYNLARWLTGSVADAEDVVQEAYLRAYRFFDTFRGDNIRVWLLTIVRNSFHTWVKENRSPRLGFVAEMPEPDSAERTRRCCGAARRRIPRRCCCATSTTRRWGG